MLRLTTIAVTLALVCPSAAIAADSGTFAKQLSNLIGSETACDLRFDMDAVRTYVEKNVRADDLDFTSSLDTEMWSVETALKQMGNAHRAAHCFQVRRSAEALGLLVK
jgi:hypothetical protein